MHVDAGAMGRAGGGDEQDTTGSERAVDEAWRRDGQKRGSAVLQHPNVFFVKDGPQGQPLRTAPKDHQLPTAHRQPLFNTVSLVLCLSHMLTMKQRVSP